MLKCHIIINVFTVVTDREITNLVKKYFHFIKWHITVSDFFRIVFRFYDVIVPQVKEWGVQPPHPCTTDIAANAPAIRNSPCCKNHNPMKELSDIECIIVSFITLYHLHIVLFTWLSQMVRI